MQVYLYRILHEQSFDINLETRFLGNVTKQVLYPLLK